MKCGVPMLWTIEGWVAVGPGDINSLDLLAYRDYFISTAENQPVWEEVPEAVIWPQHTRVLWN